MSKGYIYKITNSNTNKIYIGSTSASLDIRLGQHLQNFQYYLDGKTNNYCSSYQILKYPESRIELIRMYDKISPNELLKEEEFFINLFGDIVVNNMKVKPLQDETKNKLQELHLKKLELKEVQTSQKLEIRKAKQNLLINKLDVKIDNIDDEIEDIQAKTQAKIQNLQRFEDTEDKIINWLDDNLLITEDKKDKTKLKDIYYKLQEDNVYISLSKAYKRKFNYKGFINLIENSNFNKYFYLDNKKTMTLRKVLLKG